jgi:hypothetical protein
MEMLFDDCNKDLSRLSQGVAELSELARNDPSLLEFRRLPDAAVIFEQALTGGRQSPSSPSGIKRRAALSRLTFGNPVRDAAGGRIDVGERYDRVSRCGTDLQVAAHTGRAAAVSEAPHAVNGDVVEAECVLAAVGRFDLARREEGGVFWVEQFV